jgi:rod shape determining protein RodA
LTRPVNIFESIDWIAILLYLIIIIFGWMNIFAVNYNEQFKSIFDLNQEYGRQLIWILLSFLSIFVLFIIDYKFYPFFSYLIYGLSMLSLLAVLVIGDLIHGSRSWLSIFGFNFQPSEFAKIATSLAIAKYLSSFDVKLKTFKSIVILLAIIAVPAVLVFLQPDWGTSIIFCFYFLVLFREGLPGWVLVLGAIVVTLFIASLLFPKFIIVIGLIILAQLVYFAI